MHSNTSYAHQNFNVSSSTLAADIPFTQHSLSFKKFIKNVAFHHGRFLDHALRKDLEQAGYIALWNASKKFNPDLGKFEHYAHRSISNAIKSEASKIMADSHLYVDIEEFIQSQENDDHKITDALDDINPVLTQLTSRQALVLVTNTIPPSKQVIFEKIYLQGMSGVEVARELGISQQAISKHFKQIELLIIEFQKTYH